MLLTDWYNQITNSLTSEVANRLLVGKMEDSGVGGGGFYRKKEEEKRNSNVTACSRPHKFNVNTCSRLHKKNMLQRAVDNINVL